MQVKNITISLDVSTTLANFLGEYIKDSYAWENLLRAGATSVIPYLDPQHKSVFAQEWAYLQRDPLDKTAPEDQRIPATRIRLDPTLDPLDYGLEEAIRQMGERLNLLWDAAKTKPETEATAAPLTTAQHQHSANIRRLTNAYQVLAGKSIRVKLSCVSDNKGSYEEVYLDLPSEIP